MLVNGYNTRDNPQENMAIGISKHTCYFISGSGYLINQHPGGACAGDSGLKTNFGLNIKLTRTMAHLQGNVTIMLDQNGRVDQITTNSLILPIAIPSDPAKPNSGAAELITRANVIDGTKPWNPITMARGATLKLIMNDKGEPVSTYLIGSILWRKDTTLLFWRNWDAIKMIRQVLNGLNLAVQGVDLCW